MAVGRRCRTRLLAPPVTALTGLHGTAALVLICVLLFAEEAGIPLPFVPGDALLIAAGLLIANGSLSPWVFLPAACITVLGGALTAYTWARALGSRPLETLATRLGAARSASRSPCAVSPHIQVAGDVPISQDDLLIGKLTHMLKEKYGIDHTTMKLERADCNSNYLYNEMTRNNVRVALGGDLSRRGHGPMETEESLDVRRASAMGRQA